MSNEDCIPINDGEEALNKDGVTVDLNNNEEIAPETTNNNNDKSERIEIHNNNNDKVTATKGVTIEVFNSKAESNELEFSDSAPVGLDVVDPSPSDSLNDLLHSETSAVENEILFSVEHKLAENAVASGNVTSSFAQEYVADDDDDDDDDDLFGEGDNDDDAEPPATNEPSASITIVDDVDPTADAKESVLIKPESSTDVVQPESSTTQNSEPTTSSDGVKPESTESIKAIPRKNVTVTSPSSPDNKKRPITYTKAALAALGLPDGVNVPFSVEKEKLLNNNPNNRKMMDTLRSLPVKLVNDALTEYDDAVQVKGNTIRNHGAYLYGVVKRYVAVQERSVSGGDGTGILPMGDTLTVAVQTRLEQLVSSGFCTREEMNDKVKSKIKMLPEKDALFALDELSSVSRSQIRNFGSYFMGILNRYMRGDDDKAKNSNTSFHHHHQTSSPPPHKASVNYPAPPQQNNNNQNSHYQRGRDRNPMNRDQPHFANNHDRDRSRDRFHNKGNDSNDHRRFQPNQTRDRNSSNMANSNSGGRAPYDTRLQPQQQQLQMPTWQQNAQQQQQQQADMMRYSNSSSSRPAGVQQQQPQQGMMSNMGNQAYPTIPPQQSQPYNPLYPQQPNIPNPNPYQPHSQQQPQQPNPSPYQTPPQQPMNPSNQFLVPQNYVPGQLQPQMQYNQQSSMMPSNPPYGTPVAPVQQPYVQQPQQPQYQINNQNQQQPQNSAYGRPNGAPQSVQMSVPHPPRTGGWQPQQSQQQQSMVPVDIMGLADKAASAVQALSTVNQMQNRPNTNPIMQPLYGGQQQQPQQAYVPPQQYQQQPQQQQPLYGAVANTPAHPTQYQPVPGQMQGGQMMQQQYNPTTQQPHMTNSYMNQQPISAHGQESNRSRRTTASLSQLSQGVQYMIQNLMATQAIEGPLDDGILGMIHDLPEALAVASLQKFATLDKSTMRNRTAYLAGLLRRELEKIQRR